MESSYGSINKYKFIDYFSIFLPILNTFYKHVHISKIPN